MTKGYLGVDASVLNALGRLVIAAGRLENTIQLVAADVYVAPHRSRTSDLLREIRRRATRQELPSHSKASPDELVGWTEAARDALSARDEVIHAAASHTLVEGNQRLRLQHLRSGRVVAQDADPIAGIIQTLSGADRTGWSLARELRHQPRAGVLLPNSVVQGAWVPICDTSLGGIDMARPTDDEMDQWWQTLGPFPRLD